MFWNKIFLNWVPVILQSLSDIGQLKGPIILYGKHSTTFLTNDSTEFEWTGLRNSTLPTLLTRYLSNWLSIFQCLYYFPQERIFNNEAAA